MIIITEESENVTYLETSMQKAGLIGVYFQYIRDKLESGLNRAIIQINEFKSLKQMDELTKDFEHSIRYHSAVTGDNNISAGAVIKIWPIGWPYLINLLDFRAEVK